MLTSQFSYQLPEDLIAKFPTIERTASRLLYLDSANGKLTDANFSNIISYLQSNDILVLNDSKVLRARFFGNKKSGGKVEILLERILNSNEAYAHIRASKAPKPATKIILQDNVVVEVLAKLDDLYKIKFLTEEDILSISERIGNIPIPTYFQRQAEVTDDARYQTVYAQYPGSVAAPTAGLHFDQQLLTAIKAKGIAIGFITLHVGAGTFQPVRVDNITEHKMHGELIAVSAELCKQIATAKANGGRVIAVGTTTTRALETAAMSGTLQPFSGETDIFIHPGYEFKAVDALITNFHLPMSTLLMLTCAFAGTDNVLRAYQHAIEKKYRFYSYGDAMFITI